MSAQNPSLEERIEVLERRLRAVEEALPGSRPTRESRRQAVGVDVDLLERLGRVNHEAELAGSVAYAGSVRLGSPDDPEARRAVWQRDHSTRELLEDVSTDLEVESLTAALGAIAHPVRLRIALALCVRAHNRREIAAIIDAASTGQLYHHLRELVQAGIVVQPRRGSYRVDPPKIIPVLTLAAAARDLGAPTPSSD